MKLILDTNVWLDWLLFDDPSVAALKAAVAEGRAEIFIDAAGEAELARVLAYDLGKRSIDAEKQAACLAECRRDCQAAAQRCPDVAACRAAPIRTTRCSSKQRRPRAPITW